MLKTVRKLKENTGEKELFVVPETPLEEKFLVWFASQHCFPVKIVNNRQSIQFLASNDPTRLQINMHRAFQLFKERFRYVEIPPVSGLLFEEAKEILHKYKVAWIIEREVASRDFPAGTVISQKPDPGGVAITDSIVYLVLSRGGEAG